MVVLAQVAVEYGGLASGDAPAGSVSQILDRITRAVPPEYVIVGLGALVAVYLLKKVF